MKTNDKFLIDMPPPTISGKLHMGHAFSYTQMDFLARYNQMKGKELIYPFGYDNNGIPTEKFAYKNGISDSPGIIALSNETSKLYLEFFEKIGMGFSKHRYNTFDNISQEIAILSFNDLKEKGLIYKAKEKYSFCTCCNKSIPNSEIENDKHIRDGGDIIEKEGDGYFIKTKDFKQELREQIEKIEWKPEKFKLRMLNWIDEMDRDWSIARRRDYGISIPGEEELKFDTWFTSSLSPQIAWASHTGIASLECPIFDIRFQAHDIISTWALYTIIKSYHHNKQIPWKKIIITGHALDKNGEKLAKSKGNCTTTDYFLSEFGGEGIRFWATQNQIGNDTMLDDEIMRNCKKLLIKIKNASKFIEFQKSKEWLGYDEIKEKEWEEIKTKIEAYFEDSDWPRAFEELSDFFWKKFCSTFIEESKKESCSLSLEKILNEMMFYWEIYFPNIKEKIQ
jgi:valyl-tRNA synthetase